MMLAFGGKLHPVANREVFNNLFTEAAWHQKTVEDDGEKIDKVLSGGIPEGAYLASTNNGKFI